VVISMLNFEPHSNLWRQIFYFLLVPSFGVIYSFARSEEVLVGLLFSVAVNIISVIRCAAG
jgi:hypothetical protein